MTSQAVEGTRGRDGGKRRIIVMMGAPGAGKGTQAALLKEHFQVPHISTGVLLREAV